MSKKLSKKVISAVIILLVLFGIYGLLQTFNLLQSIQSAIPFQLASGFTTLSLSNVQASSSDSILNGSIWAMTFTAGGAGQAAYGASASIPKNSVTASDGSQASQDLWITLTSQKQICSYPIATTTNQQPLYRFYVKKYSFGGFTSLDQVKSQCQQDVGGATIIAYGKPSFSFDALCVYGVSQGIIGAFPERPNIETKVDLKIQNNLQSFTGTISNKEMTQVKFGDIAYAQLSGALQTYDQCPQALQEGKAALYQSTSGTWRLIDSNANNQYQTQYISSITALKSSTFPTEDAVNSNILLLNSKSDAVLAPTSFSFLSTSTTSNFIGGKDTGAYIVNLDNAIYIPVITLFVKASWLGISTPIPIPQIIGTTNISWTAGNETGIEKVTVKNIGSQAGNINVYTQCPSPLNVLTGSQTITLQPSEQQTLNFNIGGSSSSPTSGVCTVYATAFSKTDSKQFTATIYNPIVCIPNTRACEGNTLKVCDGNGLYSQVKDCSSSSQVCGRNSAGILDCVSQTTQCKGEDQPVSTLIGEKCCQGLVESAEHKCVYPVTTCTDGTKLHGCSTVTEGYRCIVNPIGQFELAKDITCKQLLPQSNNTIYYVLGGAIIVGGTYWYFGIRKRRR